MTMRRDSLRRRAASGNPNVAIHAMVASGLLLSVSATTDAVPAYGTGRVFGASAALAVPAALGSVGFAIAARYSGTWAHNDNAAHTLVSLKAGSDVRASVYKHSDNKVYASVTDGTDTVAVASAAQTIAANALAVFVARATWAASVDLTLNGTAVAQGDAAAVAAQTITSVSVTDSLSGSIGPLVVVPGDLSAADTALLSAGLSAGWSAADLVRFFVARCVSGALVLPLQSDSVGYLVR